VSIRLSRIVLSGMIGLLLHQIDTTPLSAEVTVLNPPQRLLVIVEHAKSMAGNDVAGTVPQGTILTATRANGSWRYSPDSKGWVHLREAIPLERAVEEMDRRLKQEPTSTSYQLRGIAHMAREQWTQAAQDFEEAYELGDSSTNLHYNLGICYERMGEPVAALEEFDLILKTYPDEFPTRLARGNLLVQTRQVQAGLRDIEQALTARPGSADAHNSRGIALRMLKRYPEAIAAYDKALEIDPRRADSIGNRGFVKKQQGDFAAAMADYEAAFKLAPTSNSIRNDLAWMLATSPYESVRDADRAISLSEAVCSATGNQDPDFLDTLAAAYARKQRFPAAIETAKLALTRVENEEAAAPIRQRIALYEMGVAYEEAVAAVP